MKNKTKFIAYEIAEDGYHNVIEAETRQKLIEEMKFLNVNSCIFEVPVALETTERFAEVVSAMQNAEEMGGVKDTTEYIVLMNAIISECKTRISAARANHS